MSSTRSRLRAPALAAVALAASLGLLSQGALVAHADDLAAATVAETSAVASDETVDGEVTAGSAVEEIEATVEPPVVVEVADPVEVAEPSEAVESQPAEAVEEEPADEAAAEKGAPDLADGAVEGESSDSLTTPVPAEGDEAALPVQEKQAAPEAALVGENLPVVTEDDYFVIAPGGTVSIGSPGLLHNDSDPEKDPIITQQFSFTTWLGNTGHIGGHGEFSFTAAPGFTGTDIMTYYAQDEGTGHGGTTGTIYVTVQANTDPNENHWPDTLPDTYTTPQDEPLSMPSHMGVLANDTDADGDTITTQAIGPTATDKGGTIIIDADGSFYYTPPAGFIGEDHIGYIARDTFGGGVWGSLVISVTPTGSIPAGPNDAPVAVNDEYFTPVNVPLHIDAATGALLNDYDPEGTALTASNDWGPSAAGGVGTVTTDGGFIYTAPTGVMPKESDYFPYTVTDEAGLSSTAIISITFTDAAAIVDEPGDPGGNTGTDHGHPGDSGNSGDPSVPAGDSDQPTVGETDGETPSPELPSTPIVTASQTTGSFRDDDELAFTGFGVWPLIGGSVTVLVLGAAGLAIARRRRAGGES